MFLCHLTNKCSGLASFQQSWMNLCHPLMDLWVVNMYQLFSQPLLMLFLNATSSAVSVQRPCSAVAEGEISHLKTTEDQGK